MIRVLSLLKPKTQPERTPEEVRRQHWDEEDRRKDLLARAMRHARYGPELNRDDQARLFREQAIELSLRRADRRRW